MTCHKTTDVKRAAACGLAIGAAPHVLCFGLVALSVGLAGANIAFIKPSLLLMATMVPVGLGVWWGVHGHKADKVEQKVTLRFAGASFAALFAAHFAFGHFQHMKFEEFIRGAMCITSQPAPAPPPMPAPPATPPIS